MHKIIDDKGRLFGRINIVDFIIIIMAIVVIPAFFHIYKVMGKMPTRVPHKLARIEAVTFVLKEMADLIKPGDVAYDEFGDQDARIVRVMETNDAKYDAWLQFLRKQGNITDSNIYIIPVRLELELLCTRTSDQEKWYYRRSPLLVGLNYALSFACDKYQATYYVTRIKD